MSVGQMMISSLRRFFSPYIIGLSFYSGAEIYYSIELGPNCKMHQLPRVIALNAIKKT